MRSSTPHSWRHEREHKALLDWYLDKQHTLSLENTLLESSNDVLLLPFSAAHQIMAVTASAYMLCLSKIQSPNALSAAVNIYF